MHSLLRVYIGIINKQRRQLKNNLNKSIQVIATDQKIILRNKVFYQVSWYHKVIYSKVGCKIIIVFMMTFHLLEFKKMNLVIFEK